MGVATIGPFSCRVRERAQAAAGVRGTRTADSLRGAPDRGKMAAVNFHSCPKRVRLNQVELVDMHFGAGEKDAFDPRLTEDHLHEIRTCHRVSRGCFFLVDGRKVVVFG